MSFLGKNKDKEDELIEQLKILNTLIFLDAQYHNTDSIMTMKEIQNEYDKIKLFSPDFTIPAAEKTEFGYQILPDCSNGSGPIYFSIIRKKTAE